jgi:hypothetical protein
MSDEVAELVSEIVGELVDRHGLARAEAIARVNERWGHLDMSSPEDVALHEDAFYWAMMILFDDDVPDWWPEADRSAWPVRPAPPRGIAWTFTSEPSEMSSEV